MSDCLQYYYEKDEDRAKYKINCSEKKFKDLDSVENFNNKDLLEFINKNYSDDAFPEDSPFEFKSDYIDLNNDQICKTTDASLAPQQKFMGQLMNQNSNFNNVLIYHGLGSGKSCTSIVIGEALKNVNNKHMIYAVPAPLVEQYYEEIRGEIRNGKFFSCPSFCLIKKNGDYERDFYVSERQNSLLNSKAREIQREEEKLANIPEENQKEFSSQQNLIKIKKQQFNILQSRQRAGIVRTFEIISHQSFIEKLFKTDRSKNLIKNTHLENGSALFNKHGLLIIDEIQRLVSAGGIFYKKLYTAIKYYCHPELKVALLSATPIYDNPYELALTMNLLRPRIPFPIDKDVFYKTFIGKFQEGQCIKSEDSKSWLSEDSCVINKELLSYLCSGYISYFKGGNPNAYPYKRIITLEHLFQPTHKSEYIQALRSDISKDKNFKSDKPISAYENLLLGNYETDNDDSISGMYVTSQQYSNIYLPKVGETVNRTLSEKKAALEAFKTIIQSQNLYSKSTNEKVNFIKTFSSKFASIIELTLHANGPVFIFSNWLKFGVEPLGILLQACGMNSFGSSDNENPKYFIWSSETKSQDKDGMLIKRARNTFNSFENRDGSRLKVILGTRSVMEGVSFRNVKQVHITEPWWNESRIEQIMARASRFCSHSALETEEQYVDIYRHYSVFSSSGQQDREALSMMEEIGKPNGWKDYESLGIDQKMISSSIKKYSINTDLNNILKSSAIDSNINKNGNLIRLEEIVVPITNRSTFQMYYNNPTNGRMYKRDGVPSEVNFMDVYNRTYTYPNKNLPLLFREAFINEEGLLETYADAEIIDESIINSDLIMKEEIEIWNSDRKYSDLYTEKTTRDYFDALISKYKLIPQLRKVHLNEVGDERLSFDKVNPQQKQKLIKCIKKLAENKLVDSKTTVKIIQEFKEDKYKKALNDKVIKIIYELKLFPETYLEQLLQLSITDPEAIEEIISNQQ